MVMGWRGSRGFTLVELMIAIALLAILVGIALPFYQDTIADQRNRTAANELHSALVLARSEAVKRNAVIRVEFTPGLPWRYGLRDAANAEIKHVEGSAFHKTTMDALALGGGNALWLQPNRGAVTTPAGLPLDSRVVCQSAQGRVACVQFNPLGRTPLCSPAGATHLMGVTECAC